MTARQSLHAIGESKPQNAAESVKFTLPTQTVRLGLLNQSESMLWQFDEEIGLPVITPPDYWGEMYGAYGEPDLRKVRSGTTTVPVTYTEYAHGGGHPQVNFARDDILGFFAPESKIANDFPRLYVGTLDDYKQLAAAGRPIQIIWGETYQRGAFAPGEVKRVREVCVVRSGEESFRTTRPATEGWVRSEKILEQITTPAPPLSQRQPTNAD